MGIKGGAEAGIAGLKPGGLGGDAGSPTAAPMATEEADRLQRAAVGRPAQAVSPATQGLQGLGGGGRTRTWCRSVIAQLSGLFFFFKCMQFAASPLPSHDSSLISFARL